MTSSSLWAPPSMQRLLIIIQATNKCLQSSYISSRICCEGCPASFWCQDYRPVAMTPNNKSPEAALACGHAYLNSLMDESTFGAFVSMPGSAVVELNCMCVFMVKCYINNRWPSHVEWRSRRQFDSIYMLFFMSADFFTSIHLQKFIHG